jgi:hypothetical protein
MKKEGTVIVSPASAGAASTAIRELGEGRFCWAYLGEDVAQSLLLEKIIGERGVRIEIGKILQKTARRLRNPYIDFVGRISRKKNSLMWWAGRFSEKNLYLSKAFIRSCYVKVAMELLEKNDANLVLFVEERSVRNAIAQSAGISVKLREEPLFNIRTFVEDATKLIFNKLSFLFGNAYRMLISKCFFGECPSKKKPLFLVYTFVTERSFDKEGNFSESYFGNLPEKLQGMGREIVFIPTISGVSYFRALKNLRQSKSRFLIPLAYLSIFDIIEIFFRTLFNMPRLERFPRFEGIEISEFVYEDMKKDWMERRFSSNLIFYYLIKRLREKNMGISNSVYTYENHTWEKILCLAMKKYYPGAYLVGYQHSSLSMMHLNYFFSRLEADILPSPDRIVTNGEYQRSFLLSSGYPKDLVVVGGALRYLHLGEKQKESSCRKEEAVILVAPSIGKSDAAELIWKSILAFGNKEGYRVLVKCHPYMPFSTISRYLKIGLPENFAITEKSIPDLLRESCLLLYTSSATCIEAITSGIPALHVESDFTIEMDQLDSDPKMRSAALTPAEIVRVAEDILSGRAAKPARREAERIFGKVSRTTYTLFLGPGSG